MKYGHLAKSIHDGITNTPLEQFLVEVLAERVGGFALDCAVGHVVVVEHLLVRPSACGHDVLVGHACFP